MQLGYPAALREKRRNRVSLFERPIERCGRTGSGELGIAGVCWVWASQLFPELFPACLHRIGAIELGNECFMEGREVGTGVSRGMGGALRLCAD